MEDFISMAPKKFTIVSKKGKKRNSAMQMPTQAQSAKDAAIKAELPDIAADIRALFVKAGLLR